jgi:hypothetical protein
VRFLLSPPPEEMETRSQRAKTLSQSTGQGLTAGEDMIIVAPKDSGEEPAKFQSGSHWGREHLRLLGVDFYMQRRIDLNRVLGVKDKDWSPELRASTPLV